MPRSPSDPIDQFQREAERLFHDIVYGRHPSAHFVEQPWLPPADLVVTNDSARVIFELAGVPRESIRVHVTGRVLEISGRRVPPQEPEGAHYHRAEIYFGEYRRVVELPWEADENKVTARYRDGLLEVRLQLKQPPAATHIPIQDEAP
jgi:HSP20 family protein